MKKKLKLIAFAICLSAMAVQAQETTQVEQLKKDMQQMRQQIEALTKKTDILLATTVACVLGLSLVIVFATKFRRAPQATGAGAPNIDDHLEKLNRKLEARKKR